MNLDHPDITERYARASGTHDLRVRTTGCDADVLLAAGYAARHDTEGALALRFWRLREGDLRGFSELVRECAGWICTSVGTPLRQRLRLPHIKRFEAEDVATQVLYWWLRNQCPACKGRRSPLIPGTARLDVSRECTRCHGTGRSLVENAVGKAKYHAHARHLASELENMDARIGVDMMRILSARMTF